MFVVGINATHPICLYSPCSEQHYCMILHTFDVSTILLDLADACLIAIAYVVYIFIRHNAYVFFMCSLFLWGIGKGGTDFDTDEIDGTLI